ncbi:hypothetical protein BH10CYA1_BH10CYA1_09100 [soil metagenome]
MNSIKNGLMVGMVALSALNAAPALAEHSHHDYNYKNYNNNNKNWNRHNDDWDRRDINVRVNDSRYDRDDYDHHGRHQQAAWNYNNANQWNSQRTLYRNNWNRVSRQRQQDLDAQMRAQWLAYHHNDWNGNYSWNTYNDPRFLDYLHTSNPSLLTTLRNYVGF